MNYDELMKLLLMKIIFEKLKIIYLYVQNEHEIYIPIICLQIALIYYDININFLKINIHEIILI
jgi:hypothetical protein